MSIAFDANGTIWFTDDGTNELVNMDTRGSVLNRLKLHEAGGRRELLGGDPSGEILLWYTDSAEKTITHFTKSGTTTQVFVGDNITGLAFGPNGHLWAADLGKAVYEVTPKGEVANTWSADPNSAITVDGEGSLWWAEADQFALVRMTPAGDKKAIEIFEGYPNDLCLGPDGALWYVDNVFSQIGRKDPSGPGRTWDLGLTSTPERIVAGKDRALWFTERPASKIGRISVDSLEITHYLIPTRPAEPYGIAVAPDGTLWFAENHTGKIGRLIPDAVEP